MISLSYQVGILFGLREQKRFFPLIIFSRFILSLQDIRLKFRKSFKPFINKGLREWRVEVHEQATDELFETFRLLHKSVAGRTTRPIESWNKQKEQIDSMESFIVSVSSEDDVLVGAGLFTYSRDSGFYSVGAYKESYPITLWVMRYK